MGTRQIQATVLLSGGIDSAACAHLLIERGLAVAGLFIDYGQAAALPEKHAAASLASHLDMPLRHFRLTGSEPFGSGELIGRNAFLIFATLFLTRGQSGIVALGLHSGTPYYDCSESCVSAIADLVAEHTDGRVSIIAPFLAWTKQDVYEYFISTKMPIALTYSCETGTNPICGTCASCRDRKVLGC